MAILSLGRGEAHLWVVDPDAIASPALIDAYFGLMTPEESTRQARFYFPKGRHEFLVTRALVRTTLSRYAAVEPAAWRFESNAYGRPAIAHPIEHADLHFNLSHTDGMIVCLVARDREIGVDVEHLDRTGETVELAENHFSPSEVHALRALPEHERKFRFFEYWTLKESYIKARGMGLSIPLDQFSFDLQPPAPIGISFDPRLPDEPTSWQFVQLRPSQRHLVAVALRRQGEPDLHVVTRETIPMSDPSIGP